MNILKPNLHGLTRITDAERQYCLVAVVHLIRELTSLMVSTKEKGMHFDQLSDVRIAHRVHLMLCMFCSEMCCRGLLRQF